MAEALNYPAGWLNPEQYHPEKNLSKARSSSKEPDYLNVAERLVWFIREQRQMIAAGLATRPFVIQTEAVEINHQGGYAIFKTFIRDVLGNEATDYGTETRTDFPDFTEKAATKSRGRALLALGYGTAFAPELDEGERIADTPRRQQEARPVQMQPVREQRQTQPAAKAPERPQQQPAQQEGDEPPANAQQKESLQKLYIALGEVAPSMESFTFTSAGEKIRELSKRYNNQRRSA